MRATTVRVAVVVNPTKIVLDDVRGVLHEEAAAAGVDDLRLLETTEDDRRGTYAPAGRAPRLVDWSRTTTTP